MSTTNTGKATVADMIDTEINGRHYSRGSIIKVINKLKMEPIGISDGKGRAPLYDLQLVAEALKANVMDKKPKGSVDHSSMNELREAKIKEEINRLKQEKVRADLEISELKRRLIDADDVKQFLMLRFGTENALLRRILFVNAPVELTGVSIEKGRKICEDYFNAIQDVMNETLLLWQNRNLESDQPLPEKIQKVIERLNEKLS